MLEDVVPEFQARARIASREAAERSAANIAAELGGSLTWGEARNLAELLPEPLARPLREAAYASGMARFAPESFARRVAERDGVTEQEARARVGGFLRILAERLPASRAEHLQQELDRFAPMRDG